ncbi:amidase signature enzyme [Leucogyrophana mollusca]|uniref:Amidase signature enzyme n=1 Tax=Leucogyrophana mollusca TaxID=85980 RepID=A0ACB8B901_9AGAM|nr:amidase signature enzyme [Leucogyrophana mollusca]
MPLRQPNAAKAFSRSRLFKTNAALSTESPWEHVFEGRNTSVNALVSISNRPASERPESSRVGNLAIAVKDNICTASMPATCSSNMLRGFVPPFDATVVNLLRIAGADIVGKTNCDEFGMGSLNVNSIHDPVINPHQVASAAAVPWAERERRSAGGSSGGSAAAVAASMCDAALGTDTGGSIRLPASYCGVVGLKPSYGLISRWGVISYADSLDCVGILGKNVDTVKTVYDAVSIFDPKDPTSATTESRDKASTAARDRIQSFDFEEAEPNLSGLRIGIPQEYFPAELDSTILDSLRRVIKRLHSLGASVVPVSLPSTPYALSAYYVIASAEASSNLARYDGIQFGSRTSLPPGADKSRPGAVYARTRSTNFGSEVQKRVLLGTYALTADAFDNYFLQAQRVRKLIRSDFNAVFRAPHVLSSPPTATPRISGVDVLLHPSAIRTAPPLLRGGDLGRASHNDGLGESSPAAASGLDTYLQDILTVPASLAGLPALSVPAGYGADGWPVGVSVIGQWGCDDLVMRIGHVVESTPPCA